MSQSHVSSYDVPVSTPWHWPLVVAHRGASAEAPENTVAAFAKAVAQQSDLIEVDIHLTKDDQIVVIHDDTTNRTAKGDVAGPIADLTLEEIQSLDAGGWKAPAYAGERVPTLQEAFTLSPADARFLVEIKAPNLEAPLARIIEQTDMAGRVVLQSFRHDVVKKCRELMPHIPAGALFGHLGSLEEHQWGPKLVDTALPLNASFVAIHFHTVTPEVVRYVKRRGLSVFTWTVNEIDDMVRVKNAGVDGIITDWPARLVSVLAETAGAGERAD